VTLRATVVAPPPGVAACARRSPHPRRWTRGTAVAALALAWLAGCSTLPRTPPSADTVSGRLAVLVDPTADAPARSVSAAFDLHGDAERGELTLTSPLGTIVAQAHWGPGAVVLERSDGERRYPDLSALAADVLGEPLPLDALFDWLHGHPWTAAPSQPLPAPAQGFEQLGWTVSLDRWPEGLLVAHRAASPGVTVRAKLAPPAAAASSSRS
jgi:outer membrane lipoprotein LolB